MYIKKELESVCTLNKKKDTISLIVFGNLLPAHLLNYGQSPVLTPCNQLL